MRRIRYISLNRLHRATRFTESFKIENKKAIRNVV